MSMFAKLQRRASEGRPVRVGLIGAGKFGSMYLSQAPRTPGIHLIAVADLSPDRARQSLRRVGWDEARSAARGMEEAAQGGTTFVTEDADGIVDFLDTLDREQGFSTDIGHMAIHGVCRTCREGARDG